MKKRKIANRVAMDAMFDTERIYKLIQQSEVSIGHPRCFSGYIDINKFAELIVQECLDIVNRKDICYHEADTLRETAQLIKQHFGVEE